jgi:orotidine-5'-phosphate decarboxylase
MRAINMNAARNIRSVPARMSDRLIVALDVRSPAAAEALVEQLDGVVSFYKIGLWLLYAEGTEQLIDKLIRDGKNVFLDTKMYDIGETVKEGVARARERGVKFVTVHGDDEMIRAAVEGRGNSDFLQILAISVLTSMNDQALQEMGYRLSVRELLDLRVRKATELGCDGMIASAADNPNEIRQRANADELLIVTPGIRPSGSGADDHKRLSTPGQAISAGADYLVVGRPITQSAEPRAAAEEVIRQMAAPSP